MRKRGGAYFYTGGHWKSASVRTPRLDVMGNKMTDEETRKKGVLNSKKMRRWQDCRACLGRSEEPEVRRGERKRILRRKRRGAHHHVEGRRQEGG